MSKEPQTLSCLEVWGGNQHVAQRIALPGLSVWVYSRPLGAGGGDLHYFSVCGHAVLSRIALADVSGHGEPVRELANSLHYLIRDHINTWDQTGFVCSLNREFRNLADSGKYATAIVLGYHGGTGELLFTNAGHLPPLWWHSGSRTWTWLDEAACNDCGLDGLPVGLIPHTQYRQTAARFDESDLLVLYTDGVTEMENASGDMLGQEGLKAWIVDAPVSDPEATGQYLTRKAAEFRSGDPADDETIIVIRRSSSAHAST